MARFFRLYFRTRPAAAVQIEFHDYADYPSKYEELARVLGHAGKKTCADECGLIRGLLQRRPRRDGSLNLGDTLFLAAMTSILSPERVIEVGTGTGFSSALMATMIRPSAGVPILPWVETIDAHEHYGSDENIRTGGDVATLIPEFASSVRAHAPRQSDFIDQLAGPNEVPFGFIDASHRHPHPLLDLLRLARVTRPGGWVALHDVALGTLVAAAARAGQPLPFEGQFGAEWLFEAWPFPKVKSGNSGAIQIPPEKREMRRVVKTLLKLPFEIDGRGHRRLRDEILAAALALSTGA